ncbi:LTV1-like protein [Mya arenaria]|uniref:Protein LTV1 homolog n=1 Tax=Mya arenaria TaxID=6604 RepID=A0ABY7FQE1_MYAAR|nr:LTV1-like protein [Mya arenaria]
MPARKKKFINKKDAVTFHLVHRSQQDPMLVSTEASQHVLVEGKEKHKENDVEERHEELRKFGVFFDDNYDYMQHLKDTNEIYQVEMVDEGVAVEENKSAPRIQLPSSALPSEYEKPVGLLNTALPIRGPRPDWDPDIVEALDDDFDFDNPDNQLDDDFMQIANTTKNIGEEGSDLEEVSDLDSNMADLSDNDDFDGDFKYGDQMFMDEETKSRFTNYSMSSSVIRRNEGLTLLDDRFEKVFEGYDDAEIGALDSEDIDGSLQQGSMMLDSIVQEFEQTQNLKKLSEVVDEGVGGGGGGGDVGSESDTDSDTELVTVEVRPEEKWDCESILSTYSNLYNHPRLIKEPTKNKPVKLKGKLGLPEDSIASRGLTEKDLNMLNQREPMDKASTYRPKDETAQERANRKKAIKEDRRERRQEKKMNKTAFTKEKIRQEKEMMNLNKADSLSPKMS